MSSVGLRDIFGTTSFRLALLFVGLFGAASLMLFGFLYWRTAGYLASDIDDWLSRASLSRAAERPKDLKRDLAERPLLDPDGERPIALFDQSGNWIVGNHAILPTPLPPADRPFDFTLPRSGTPAPFRGMTRRLSSGEIVLVARDMRDITHFRELLLEAIASGGLVVLVLGLAGAAITGAGALGHIDRVVQSIERIVNGDLTERLPQGSNAGDVNRLVEVVNHMLDEIERLMNEVKGASEDIAHDLRTPLTRLLAGLERTRRRPTSREEFASAVDEAIVEIRDLLATFAALLRIAEVEAGARRAGFTTVDLATVAEDVAELFEPVAESHGISLSLKIGRDMPAITGDPSLLFEAIGNLVDNAIKYTPAGGRVTVRTYTTDHRLGIEVSDTGPGIAAAERNAVLRRFHRTEKSRNTPGCGLGLSLVAAVANLHGLHLVIEDAGPGCRVTLWRNHDDATYISAAGRPAIAAAG
jgi:signal transduction histidine kinase